MSILNRKKIALFLIINLCWIINLQMFHLTTLRVFPYLGLTQAIQAGFLLYIQVCLYALLKNKEMLFLDPFQFSLMFIIIFLGYFSTSAFFALVIIFIYYSSLIMLSRNRFKRQLKEK